MIIQRIDIDGFGIWRSLRMARLDQPLTVFYGPNEAGKTTVMQFLRSMLYGLSPERRAKYLPPVHGGTPGGAIYVLGPRGRREVARNWASPYDSPDGQLKITAADGTVQPDDELQQLCGGVDDAIFNNVFAVGLREVQELATLDDTAAAERLYQLSTGLDRVSLLQVLRNLAAARNRLAGADERSSQLVQLIDRHERLTREIDQLRSLVHEYDRLTAEQQRLDDDLAARQREHESLLRHARIIEAARSVREAWRRREELAAQLLAQSGQEALPPGAQQRLTRIDRIIARRRHRLATLRKNARVLATQIAGLPIRSVVERHSVRIMALVEHRPWIETLREQRRQLEAQRAELERQLSEERAALGPDHIAGRGSRFDERAGSRLKPLARQCHAARRQWKAAARQRRASDAAAESLSAELRRALGNSNDDSLAPILDRSGRLVSQLRRRVQLDQRLEELHQDRDDLADECERLVERQVLPPQTLTALGAAFVLGAVMLLAGLFLPWLGALGWVLVIAGLAGAGAAWGGKQWMERSNARRLDVCRNQLRQVHREIDASEAERNELDEQLPRGGGPLLARLQSAEKELSRFEALVELDRRCQAARDQAEQDRQAAETAERDARAARRRWQEALAAAGLSTSLTGGNVRRLALASRRVEELEGELARIREQCRRVGEQLDSLAARVVPVANELGLASTSGDMPDLIQQMERLLADQRRLLAQREELESRRTAIRRKLRRGRAALKRSLAQRRALFTSAGAVDENEFNQRAALARQRDGMRREQEQLSAEIVAKLPSDVREESLAEILRRVTPPQLDQHAARLAERAAMTQRHVNDALQQRGRVLERLRAAVNDRRLGATLTELGAVEQQLRDSLDRWRIVAVAERLIEGVRRKYEKDKQPAVLQDASMYLERLTRGAYRRVWTPLDAAGLRVDDARGRAVEVEVLSQGTREQLFLSLRLALAASYARSGADLPLVLDDVLVNFDVDRAAAAAEVLRDFAHAGHQVFVFTCHEHIARAFADVGAVTRRIDSEAPLEFISEPAEEPQPATDAEPARPRATPARIDAEPPLWTSTTEEQPEAVPPGRRQRRRRARGRRSAELFADAIWHERVRDDLPPSDAIIELDDNIDDDAQAA